MALATLSIDLFAKLAELQAGMDKAGRIAEKTAAGIEARFQKMSAASAGIGGALAGAVSVAGLGAVFKATVDGLDKMNDLADATGATVENLSALEDIAARTGTSVDTVGDALVKMNKFLGEAVKPGSEAADALKRIGLSGKELAALDPAQALQRIAVALAGYGSSGEKARLVQEIFGKSIREVAPLLKDMAEAGQLNATVTKAQAEEAEKFNKQLFAFTKNVQDAARALTSELLPSLNKFFVGLSALTKLGAVGFTGIMAEVLKGNTFADAGQGVIFYTDKLKDLQKQRDIIAADKNPVSRRGGLIDIDGEITKVKELQSFYRAIFGGTAPDLGQTDPAELARRGRGGLATLAPATEKGKPVAAVRAPRVELDDATKNALKAIEATDVNKARELNEALAKLFDIFTDAPNDPAFVQALANLNKQLVELDPAARAAAEAQKKLNEAIAATPAGQLETLRAEADRLAEALGKATDPIMAEKLAQALGQVYDRMRGVRGEVVPLAQEVSEFARQAGRNIQDALGDTLAQSLGGKFNDIGKLWGDMLKRMVAQAIAVDLNKWLVGDDFAKTGKVGGAVAAGWEWLKSIPSFDVGTPYVPRDTLAMVHKGERILTASENRAASSGGGVGITVNNIVNVQGDASANTLRLIQNAQAGFAARLQRPGAY